jgi:murein DD-endopeptidase MepM/ murein hydrolase activator NlpD
MDREHSHHRLRTSMRLFAATLVMAVPAAAIAAEPPDRGPGTVAGGRALIEHVSGPLEQEAARAESGPDRLGRRFHPVRGPVGYGEAEAAFGNARGRPHDGQDIFAAAGTPVIAPADGVVAESGSDGGRGNWLAIYDPKRKLTYSYFHLLTPGAVAAGDRVEAGQTLGRVGCSGSCWGDHLHFEIRRGRGPYGAAIDPMPSLQRWQRLRR